MADRKLEHCLGRWNQTNANSWSKWRKFLRQCGFRLTRKYTECGRINILFIYMASVGNREIFTESGFHGICCNCYILHIAWCESNCWVTGSIRKTRFIYLSENTFASWQCSSYYVLNCVRVKKWGTEYPSRTHKKLISTQHKLCACDDSKRLFPLSQNIFGTKEWTHHHTLISFQPTILWAYSKAGDTM